MKHECVEWQRQCHDLKARLAKYENPSGEAIENEREECARIVESATSATELDIMAMNKGDTAMQATLMRLIVGKACKEKAEAIRSRAALKELGK